MQRCLRQTVDFHVQLGPDVLTGNQFDVCVEFVLVESAFVAVELVEVVVVVVLCGRIVVLGLLGVCMVLFVVGLVRVVVQIGQGHV